jgi:hypothetical protein
MANPVTAAIQWSPDGEKFALHRTNVTTVTLIFTFTNLNPESQMVFEAKGQWSFLDFSSDGKQALIYNYISINESSVYC